MLIVSPRLIKETADRPPAFSVDATSQVHLVGYSRDFHICEGVSANPGGGPDTKCRNFVNRTNQWVCARHKYEQAQKTMAKSQARRMATMGSRVDVNAIRQLDRMRVKEQKASAVGGFNRL